MEDDLNGPYPLVPPGEKHQLLKNLWIDHVTTFVGGINQYNFFKQFI